MCRLYGGGGTWSSLSAPRWSFGDQPQKRNPGLRSWCRCVFVCVCDTIKITHTHYSCTIQFMFCSLCADFVLLEDSLTVRETYIAGQLVWRKWCHLDCVLWLDDWLFFFFILRWIDGPKYERNVKGTFKLGQGLGSSLCTNTTRHLTIRVRHFPFWKLLHLNIV